jgi:DNA invertase Pin-like site-specific DNA recombinase
MNLLVMAAGCAKVYQEKLSGARTDRAELAKVVKRLERDDLLIVTRLDRLARSTRDLLNILRTAISRSLTRSLRRTIQAG